MLIEPLLRNGLQERTDSTAKKSRTYCDEVYGKYQKAFGGLWI